MNANYKVRFDEMLPEQGDAFKNCKLNRRKYANILESLIVANHTGCVVSLNGEWGSGKTTFVRMFQQHLDDNGYSTIYYNAWKSDFVSDPLVALLGELKGVQKTSAKLTELFNDTVKTIGKIAVGIAPTVGKGLAKKYLTEDVVDYISATLEEGGELLKKEIELYEEETESIEKFKKQLEKYVNSLGEGKPLVFIVDELDRCNPHFAVRVLERIKHLFSVPNVVFLISVDKVQLCNSIRGYYGSDMINAEEYLWRFIDVEYYLPEPDYESYIGFELERLDFSSFFNKTYELKRWEDSVISLVVDLSNHSRISLRQIQKMLVQLRLVFSTLYTDNDNSLRYLTPLFLLVYFRMFERSLYDAIKAKRLTLQQLVDKIEEVLPATYFTRDIATEYSNYTLTSAFVTLLALYSNDERGYPMFCLSERGDNVDDEIKLSFFVDKFDEVVVKKVVSFVSNSPIYYNNIGYLIDRVELYHDLQDK